MDDLNFQVNGDFIVCSMNEQQADFTNQGGILLSNKVEEGFQKINNFKIVKIAMKDGSDFPFSTGDVVVVASSGTKVDWKGKKFWLFSPEHVLAKIGESF